jgi:hypothetical protein
VSEPDWGWMMERQRQYERLLAEAGGAPADRAIANAFELHERIAAKVDSLPVDWGGRAEWWGAA